MSVVWHPNCGYPPTRDQPEDEAPLTHVYVRLRNGIEPVNPWPVEPTRSGATRWAFGMREHPFDIVAWRRP